jgi:hypothetical protein
MSENHQNRIEPSGNNQAVAIYHRVYAKERFEEAAQTLFRLVREAQKKSPGAERLLYLDIDGHRNRNGGFDSDMLELQQHFILDFLMQFLTEVNMPLAGRVRRKDASPQSEDIPEELKIQNRSAQDS